VADAPDQILLGRDRDMQGRGWHPWLRRTLMALFALIPILALANLFGQRPTTSIASTSAASMKVYAPTRIRGGLLYEARIHIKARRDIKKAFLELGTGWLEGTTLNTLEPSPISEASANGNLLLELGHIADGDSYIQFIQFQVNPTNVGRRSRSVTLFDGKQRLTAVHQKVTIFP
jgi:hypothetical protein